jgi:hypothetical protein
VNRLTDPTLDPISKMPAFKVAAASIERIPIERITTITDSFLRNPTQELISFD